MKARIRDFFGTKTITESIFYCVLGAIALVAVVFLVTILAYLVANYYGRIP